MKRKIENYLKSKDKIEYNNLDRLFELYLSGDINNFLSKYTGVEIYPIINKLGKTIQLNYHYHNICVIIDFFEDKYNVVIYHTSIREERLEKLFIDYEYPIDFCLEKLIKEIDDKIKTNPKLRETFLIEKKKKIYNLIASISLCLSMLICGSMALYCVITKSTIKTNMWFCIFFIVIPLIIWFIYDVKSKRLK